MNIKKLEKLLNSDDENEDFQDEFLEFEKIENKRSQRPDIHAFLLLDSLCPGDCDMVSGADHDIIFLDVEIEDLAKVITEEQAIELVRCGVMYSDEYDCLSMFV